MEPGDEKRPQSEKKPDDPGQRPAQPENQKPGGEGPSKSSKPGPHSADPDSLTSPVKPRRP
jgi:hypothetical protein